MSRQHRNWRWGLTGTLLLGLAACQSGDWPRYRVDRVQHREQAFLAGRALDRTAVRQDGTLSLGDTYLRFCADGDRPCLLVRGTFPQPGRFRGEWAAPRTVAADRSRFVCAIGASTIRCTETLREESGQTARMEHTFTRLGG